MQLARETIYSELQQFEQIFNDAMKSDVVLLNRIMADIAAHKGKQMRPMFVLLCARLCGDVNNSSLPGCFAGRVATYGFAGA